MPKPRQETGPMIERGLEILYKNGYSATGMQEIAAANNMTKGAMYGYFSSKEEFVIKAIALYTEQTVAYLKENLLNDKHTPLENLRLMLEDWAQKLFSEYDGCGCFTGNMAQEMGNASDKIRLATKKSFDELEKVYCQCIHAAVDARELPKDTEPRLLSSLVFNGWQGAMVRAKSEQDSQHLSTFIEHIFKKLLH